MENKGGGEKKALRVSDKRGRNTLFPITSSSKSALKIAVAGRENV